MAKKGGTLFDSTPRTKPAPKPAWLVPALVRLGMGRADAARSGSRAAFAKLAELRQYTHRTTTASPRERRQAAWERARSALNDSDEYTADELTDVIVEAIAPLGSIELRRVLAGLANLLAERLEVATPA